MNVKKGLSVDISAVIGAFLQQFFIINRAAKDNITHGGLTVLSCETQNIIKEQQAIVISTV